MRTSSWILLILIVVLILAAFVGVRYNQYSDSAFTPSAYVPPQRNLESVKLEQAALPARLEVVDNPTVSRGVVVFDFNHNNALFVEELNVLFSKIVSRGFSYELVTSASKDGQKLADKLRYAKALALPLPRSDFSAEEVAEIKRFVEKGGRLLIIGDPTRTVAVDAINSLAGSFNIVYANDYLYSLESNDNNYRNVVYSNFADSPITRGLSAENKIIFYGGGSISAPGHEIILGDETIFSSLGPGGRALAAAALTTNDQVLALGDLTFLGEPYSSAESNGMLINNIADFLTGGSRSFELKDFPYFFNPTVDIVFDDTLVFNSQFGDSVKLKEALEANGATINFANEITDGHDVIFIGRFDQTEAVEPYLQTAGISLMEITPTTEVAQVEGETESGVELAPVSDAPASEDEEIEGRFIEGRIQIEGIGDLESGGSTLFHLYQEEDRNILVILSANADTNADAFELLLDHEFTECLARPFTAVCQTEKPKEEDEVEPSIRSRRVDKILVVADNDGRSRNNKQTGAMEFQSILSNTYKVNTWFTADGNELTLDELQEYDAVIWTTGDYWDDSIEEADTELLTEYIETGGNLLLSGSSIAFDWDHTDFLTTVAHADYLTFAKQADIQVAMPDHPIAREFEEEQVITFTETLSDEATIGPDVVAHTNDARVIFQRGPESENPGAASVIVYEDDRSKVAYYVFPIYVVPAEARAALVNNTIDWFERRPLELPKKSDYEPYSLPDGEEAKEGEGAAGGEEGQGSEEGEEEGQEGDEGDQGDEGNGEDEGDQDDTEDQEDEGDQDDERGEEDEGDQDDTEDEGDGNGNGGG
jgi:hypothetical protein